jgi:nicotinate-nucleotide--dimethylbenzimidazole phosphoribosyltransferase
MSLKDSAPLDDARDLIRSMPAGDEEAGARARSDLARRYGRPEDFGKLATLGSWLATWQRRTPPRVEKPVVAIFVGSHGLAGQGVSITSGDTVRERMAELRAGRNAVNALATQESAIIRIFELGLDQPTANITEAPAMTARSCAATIAYGFEALVESPDCLALGVMGAGVGTAAAAVACALYGGDPGFWVRPGPGTPAEVARARAELVGRALTRHRKETEDPLCALAALGGRELAACVGAITAARHQGVPVILDGFATAVAAGVVKAIRPDGIDHCVAASKTLRPAHEAVLERIGMKPLLDIGVMSGGAVGSTLALGLVRAASALHLARTQDEVA